MVCPVCKAVFWRKPGMRWEATCGSRGKWLVEGALCNWSEKWQSTSGGMGETVGYMELNWYIYIYEYMYNINIKYSVRISGLPHKTLGFIYMQAV